MNRNPQLEHEQSVTTSVYRVANQIHSTICLAKGEVIHEVHLVVCATQTRIADMHLTCGLPLCLIRKICHDGTEINKRTNVT